MVKGIQKQVILVRSPDPELFEQAIFILRDEALGREGVSDRAVLRQARQAAMGYIPSEHRSLWTRGPVWAGAGALATGVIWALCTLL